MGLHQVFINSAGRLRSGWRLLVFLLIFIIMFFVVDTAARIGYAIVLQIVPSPRFGHFIENVIFRLTFLVSSLVGAFVCTRWLEGLPWGAVGLSLHEGWLRDFLIGSGIGILSLALATVIATAGGGLSFTFFSGSVMQIVKTLIVSAVMFVIAALAEEALFRGYPLQTLTRAGLAIFGVLLTSAAFAGIHFGNPNFKQGIPILNLVLAGVWFGVAYLRTRSLWLPWGIHWAWNWALGSLFGLPVSGITSIAPYPLLRGTDLGPAWLTGGSFGIEGGIACTIALTLSTIFIWRTKLLSATEDMNRLTSQENPRPAPYSGLRTQDSEIS
jgi:membrane protease YdiL (CAAX protease family)